MSLQDKNCTLSDDQSVAIAAGTVLSDSSYDLGTGGSIPQGGTAIVDPGRGSGIELDVRVTTTCVGATATLKVELVSATDAALTGSLTVLESTDTVAVASLVAGYKFRLGRTLPAGIAQRYIGLRYTVATATLTAGKVRATLASRSQLDAMTTF